MQPARGALRAAIAAGYVVLAAAWIGVLVTGSATGAFVFFLASRTGYVTCTGLALRAQDGNGWWTRRWGAEEGFFRFRQVTALLMYNDAVAIGAVCWMSRNSLRSDLPWWGLESIGAALVLIGVGVKCWAVAPLEPGSYYWRSFFAPASNSRYVASGPYRWLANPMYTVGYMQAYGVALCLRSLPGLAAAAYAHALILLFNQWVERPHTERMRVRASGAAPPMERRAAAPR